MPLSNDEEKILAQIEAGIRKTDPNLAQQVEQTTIYSYSGRKIALTVFGIVLLLAIIVFTFSGDFWIVSFVAFGVMVLVGISLVEHIVKIGKAGVDDAKKQAQKISPSTSWRGRRDL